MKAEFIQKLLDLTGLTKKEFAKRLDVSDSTLRNWLSSENEPTFHNQKAIRSVFKDEVRGLKIKTI